MEETIVKSMKKKGQAQALKRNKKEEDWAVITLGASYANEGEATRCWGSSQKMNDD